MIKRCTTVLLSAACLSLACVAGAQNDFEPQTNKAQQLRLAQLHFLAATADPYTALAYQRRFTPAELSGGDYGKLRVALAEQAAAFGLYDRAAASYQRDLNASAANADYLRRNRDWFKLAQAWYARGFYAKAQNAFDNIYGAVPDALKNELPPFESRLLIAQGRNEEAVKLLRKWQRKRVRDPFARYNLAVALARAGKQQEGTGELNNVGTLKSKKELHLALRDQANLVLGFGYLEIGQGATARALFQRIRLDGPYSEKALLGFGWSELAPDGTRQKHTLVQTVRCIEDPARLLPDTLPVLRRVPREACGPPQQFRDTDKFKTKKGGDTEAEKYRRALLPWLELIRRDSRLNAVQEGLVAVPYAYAKIGALDLADEYYAKAISILEPLHDNVNFAIKQLKQSPERGAVLPPGVEPNRDWFALRWGLYTAADAPFFSQVLTDPQFRIAAQSLQDLLVLRDQLLNSGSRVESMRALLTGRRVALYRANIELPPQLFDEQQTLDAASQHIDKLMQHTDNAIYNLGEHLRKQALASAIDHEERLQSYLTQARVGRANAVNVTTAEGSTQ